MGFPTPVTTSARPLHDDWVPVETRGKIFDGVFLNKRMIYALQTAKIFQEVE
jgi:hypothetical protein